MVFNEALTEYLIDGLSEALAEVETPTPPVPLAVDRSPCHSLARLLHQT